MSQNAFNNEITTRKCRMKEQPEFEHLIEKLVSEQVSFVAVPESDLEEGRVRVLYHSRVDRQIGEVPDVKHVTIDGETYPVRCVDILHTDVHFVRCIPIYSTGVFGTASVSIKKGVENIIEHLATEYKPTTEPAETVPIKPLIQELVDAGAVKIGIDKEIFRWGDENLLRLRVSLEPGIGVPIVKQYSGVVVNGDTYDVDCICDSINGPTTFQQVTLYASDDIMGMDAVTVDAGQKNLREFLQGEGEFAGFGAEQTKSP